MEEAFRRLEAERARVYNLPDSEFSEAYMGFRRSAEETIKLYTDFLNVGPLPLGNGLAWLLGKLLNIFGGAEGTNNFPREQGTFTLDPAPFQKMMDVIFQKTKPTSSYTNSSESKLTDLNKLKQFAASVIDTLLAYGVSKACSQKEMYTGIKNILDSIDVSDQKTIVRREANSQSIEVKKSNAVVLASYHYKFSGYIHKGCCSDDNMVTLTIEAKVWKFACLADLKNEYMRVK